MPGIPLLNIGTALGGLAGGWNQARSQGLQQAIQQLALQQQQGLTNQQTLASLALQAGLLNQPGGGQTPLQAATGAVPNQTAPAPTQTASSGGGPQISPSSGMPMPQGYTYTPPAPMSPYGPPDASSQDAPPDDSDLSPAGQVMHNPQVLAGWQSASGYDPATDPTHITLTHPGGSDATQTRGSLSPQDLDYYNKNIAPSGMSQTEYAANLINQRSNASTPTPLPTQIERGSGVGGSTPAPAQGSDSGQGSGGGVGIQLPNGQVIDMSTMFQRVDYQKLAQGIARLAPPGTSQADIYGAVVDLAKLGEGDKVQQQQAGLLLRALTNGEFKLAGINAQGAIRSGQIAQQGAIRSGQIAQQGDIKSGQITQQGNIRSGIQTQKDAAAEQRQKERLAQQAAQFNQRLSQASRIANTTAKDTQLRALLGDIDKQLNPGGLSVPPQGDELFQLQRERVQIVNELRKLQGLPAVPMPQAPATQ